MVEEVKKMAKRQGARVDAASVVRRAVTVALPAVRNRENLDAVSVAEQKLGWLKPRRDEYVWLIGLLRWFVDSSRFVLEELEAADVVVCYDLLFGDVEIRLIEGDTSAVIASYELQTTELKIRSLGSSGQYDIPVVLHQTCRFRLGQFSYYTTAEQDAVIKTAEERLSKVATEHNLSKNDVKEIVSQWLQDDLGRNVKIEVSPKGRAGDICVTINGKTSVFKAGDKTTDLLRTICRASRGLSRRAEIATIYETIFEYDDFYGDANKERRSKNMKTLRNRVDIINEKIKRETQTPYDLLVRAADTYVLNPAMHRVTKPKS